MIPLEKVQSIVDTYETIEKELASADIDKKDFVKKSKEYSNKIKSNIFILIKCFKKFVFFIFFDIE